MMFTARVGREQFVKDYIFYFVKKLCFTLVLAAIRLQSALMVSSDLIISCIIVHQAYYKTLHVNYSYKATTVIYEAAEIAYLFCAY